MNAPAHDGGRLVLMLSELRLPTISSCGPSSPSARIRKAGPGTQLLGALPEHELAERAKRRIERHRTESHLDPTKTLAAFDFGAVSMVSNAHVTAMATGESSLEKGIDRRRLPRAPSRVPASSSRSCSPRARACSCLPRWPSSIA